MKKTFNFRDKKLFSVSWFSPDISLKVANEWAFVLQYFTRNLFLRNSTLVVFFQRNTLPFIFRHFKCWFWNATTPNEKSSKIIRIKSYSITSSIAIINLSITQSFATLFTYLITRTTHNSLFNILQWS